MATTIQTTDYIVTTSGYLSGTTHYFYSGNHNYLSVQRRTGSTATAIYVEVGSYDPFFFNTDSNGKGVVDITSVIRVLKGTTSTMLLEVGGTAVNIAVIDGINPADFLTIAGKGVSMCAVGGNVLNNFLPPTMIYSSNSVYPAWQTITGTSISGATYSNDNVFISQKLIKIGTNAFVYRLKEQDDNKRYCEVFFKSPFGHNVGGLLTALNGRIVMEVFSTKVSTDVTSLQTYGDAYKAIVEPSVTITIGLKGVTAYDVAYHSQLIMSDSVKIDGQEVEPATKAVELFTGVAGNYDIQMTFKYKNYATT